jgi:hypothetical protein
MTSSSVLLVMPVNFEIYKAETFKTAYLKKWVFCTLTLHFHILLNFTLKYLCEFDN